MLPFQGEYLSSLNSEDLHDPELPLLKSVTHGGTMILWKRSFDPFIKVVPVNTTAFLPIIFSPPNHQLTIHFAVYLPTSGKEHEFIEEVSKLKVCMEKLRSSYPEALFYLRGDFNVNDKNKNRTSILNIISEELELCSLSISHPTYHHFMGGGASDSHLDKIFFPKDAKFIETLINITCKLTNPLIDRVSVEASLYSTVA